MKTEFEISYPNIDHEEIRDKIIKLGGVCIQEKTFMKRVVFKDKNKELKNSYFRVRNEGNKITLTYKTIIDGELDIHSIKEVETEVTDFEATVDILALAGLEKTATQETFRETWKIGDEVEFMLDQWPGLKSFIEIEGKNEEIVKKYSEKLGFDYMKGVFGAVDELYYREHGIPHDLTNSTQEITFENLLTK